MPRGSTSSDIGPEPKLDWISLDLLMTDHNYQRDAIPRHVQSILINFNWRYFQPPTVCPSENANYWVIDGQQRVLAAKLHPAVNKVPCYIIDTPMTEEQATAFIRVNKDRRNVNSVNMYWAGLAAKDEKYLAVRRVLHSAGAEVVHILGARGVKRTNAVGCILLSIKTCGENNVGLALQVLCEAHPDTPGVLMSNTIRALSIIFRDHEEISKHLMIKLLAGTDLDTLCIEMLNARKILGGSTVSLLSTEIMKRYTEKASGINERS